MTMTRKHFEAHADLCVDIIKDLDRSLDLTLGHIDDVLEKFCDMCEGSNPKFNRKRFRRWVLDKLNLI